MRHALLALALLLVVGTDARALTDAAWNQKQHAANFPLDQLPAPSAAASPSTAPVRPIDLNPAGAPCILSAPGANGLPVCATPLASLSVTDPISSTGGASPTLGLKFTNVDLILTVPGALEVAAFTGAITKAAGATSTIFGFAGAHTVLANLTGGSAVPTFTGPATGGQFLGDSGWASVPTTSITGLAAIATSGSATDLITGTIPAAREPSRTGATTNASGSTVTAFGAAGPMTALANGTGASAVPTFVGPATVGQVFQALTSSSLGFGALPSTSVTGGADGNAFFNASGALTSDPTHWSWDPTNFRAGLRVAAPAFQLHVVDEAGASDRGVAVGEYSSAITPARRSCIKSRGSFASPTTVATGDYGGRDDFLAYDGSAYLNTLSTGTIINTVTGSSVSQTWFVAANSTGISSDPFANGEVVMTMGSGGLLTLPKYASGGGNISGGLLLVDNVGSVTRNANLTTIDSGGPQFFYMGPQSGTSGGLGLNNWNSAITGTSTWPGQLVFANLDSGRNTADTGMTFLSPASNAGSGTGANIIYSSPTYSGVGGANALIFDNYQNTSSTPIGRPMSFNGWSAAHAHFVAFQLPGDGSTLWYDSAAAVSLSGSSGIRSASGTLQYSENGGAWVSFDSLVPSSRTVQGTAPISIGGGHSALDLSLNRVWSLDTNGVANSFLAQMGAATLKGNDGGSLANAADLTATQVTAMLNPFTSSLQGLAPSSGGGTSNFLRADGTWVVPPGTGVPTARTLTMTAPMTCDGGGSCDLCANRTIATPVFAGSAAGLVPPSSGGTTAFLRADGTYAVPAGTGGSGTVTGVFGTSGQVTVTPSSPNPIVSLVAKGAGAGAYGGSGIAGFSLDAFGAVTAVTPATYLTSTGTTPGTYSSVTVESSGLVTAASITIWMTSGSMMKSGGLGALPVPGVAGTDYSAGTASLASGPLCNTNGTGALSVCTSTNLYAPLGFPTFGQVLVSGGPGTEPIGDSTFTFNPGPAPVDGVQTLERHGNHRRRQRGSRQRRHRHRERWNWSAFRLAIATTSDLFGWRRCGARLARQHTVPGFSEQRHHDPGWAHLRHLGHREDRAERLYRDRQPDDHGGDGTVHRAGAPPLTGASGATYALHVASGESRLRPDRWTSPAISGSNRSRAHPRPSASTSLAWSSRSLRSSRRASTIWSPSAGQDRTTADSVHVGPHRQSDLQHARGSDRLHREQRETGLRSPDEQHQRRRVD